MKIPDNDAMLVIDGAMGEGGGQILRTALTLSLCLGRPFRIERIRARRRRPGLQRQHLAAVRAAAAVSDAEVSGAEPDSQTLLFRPGPVRAGEYRFDIGTAGSTTLVLQTILLPLLQAGEPSQVIITGGTHNPLAPPFEFLATAWLPLLRRMGADITLELERPGFHPAGGGRIRATIHPLARLSPLHLYDRGPVRALRAEALLCHLPRHIGERELRTIAAAFELPASQQRIREDPRAPSPGNAVSLCVESRELTEVFTALGRRGLPAEKVALQVVEDAREYLRAKVAAGRHLADQLLLPLALAGSGGFTTLPPSRHTTTNRAVIQRFLDLPITIDELATNQWRIDIGPTGA